MISRCPARRLSSVRILWVGPHNFPLSLAARITHPNPHQEPVQLRLRQRIGAVMFNRVLRGNHHERLREPMGAIVNGHLAFIHGFEQRALGLRRGAVDLIGQQDIRKNRAGFEFKTFPMLVVNGDADDVARQQIAGELHPLKLAVQAARQGMGQCGFSLRRGHLR